MKEITSLGSFSIWKFLEGRVAENLAGYPVYLFWREKVGIHVGPNLIEDDVSPESIKQRYIPSVYLSHAAALRRMG